MVKVKEVFVAGGIPNVTYVARDDRKLEKSLGAAIDEGCQIICITGPTKSGKSVFVVESWRAGKASGLKAVKWPA